MVIKVKSVKEIICFYQTNSRTNKNDNLEKISSQNSESIQKAGITRFCRFDTNRTFLPLILWGIKERGKEINYSRGRSFRRGGMEWLYICAYNKMDTL